MKRRGFTIIELITVISIIVLLIAIMTPAIRKVKESATRLQQRAQLRDIEIGLEQWHNDQDYDYPDSRTEYGATYTTTGAHHLAEALLGRDSEGFDSRSTWNAEDDEADALIYSTANYYDRERVFLDLDDAFQAQVAQIYDYGTTNTTFSMHPYPGDYDEYATATGQNQAIVLTDVFRKKKITTPEGEGAKVGMPILYYKAKDTRTFDSSLPTTSVFNYLDNAHMMMLGNNMTDENHPFFTLSAGTQPSPDQTSMDEFYAWLVNPMVRGGETPYNKDTFLLLSAGPDGLYGTKDDVHNMTHKN